MTDLHNGGYGLETVWQTVENMRQIGDSIESFYTVLELEIRKIEYIHGISPITLSDPTSMVGYDWCYASDLRVYELIKKSVRRGRKPSLGALTVRVELWREVDGDRSDGWQYAKAPLILIGFSRDKNDPWDRHWLSLDQYGNPEKAASAGARVLKEAPWLWTWDEEIAWNERSWFFVVPLEAIKSREDIVVNIVGPVGELLADKPPCQAFRKGHAIRHENE